MTPEDGRQEHRSTSWRPDTNAPKGPRYLEALFERQVKSARARRIANARVLEPPQRCPPRRRAVERRRFAGSRPPPRQRLEEHGRPSAEDRCAARPLRAHDAFPTSWAGRVRRSRIRHLAAFGDTGASHWASSSSEIGCSSKRRTNVSEVTDSPGGITTKPGLNG